MGHTQTLEPLQSIAALRRAPVTHSRWGSPLEAEADYLLFPLNRQEPCKHWVLAALDLRTKQFTLLDSYARNDKGAILGRAEIETLQEYLDHAPVWTRARQANRLDRQPVSADQPPQQYDLHDPRKKLAGIDCGLFCLFCAVALSYGGGLTFSQEDMLVLRQRAIQLVTLSARLRSFDLNLVQICHTILVHDSIWSISSFCTQ